MAPFEKRQTKPVRRKLPLKSFALARSVLIAGRERARKAIHNHTEVVREHAGFGGKSVLRPSKGKVYAWPA